MLSITRWEPYRDVLSFHNRLSQIFNDPTARPHDSDGFGAWMPPVDIVEEGERLVFRAEIPGMAREDIEVKVENGTLTLRGEKRQEKNSTEGSAHRVERLYGSFVRSFSLPTSVDAEKIQATYKDGVLELVLPKAEQSRPRRIAIK
jgi:HSP20 family protein